MNEYLVVATSPEWRGEANHLREIPAEDVYEALDIASNAETWKGAGFVTVWENGDVLEQFFSQEDALAHLLTATGRA